jgi:hypothetical protein
LNNDKLSTVYFDNTPSNCVHRVAWYKEGLAVPPVDIARKGWAAVFKYLREKCAAVPHSSALLL